MEAKITIDLALSKGTVEYDEDIYPFEVKDEVISWEIENFPNLYNTIIEMFKSNTVTLTVNKHEYLENENYYETKSVGKGRTDKTCEHCGGNIPAGTEHVVHKFYPEFSSYPTHLKCEKAFMDSLL
jgi:hypothetical protein